MNATASKSNPMSATVKERASAVASQTELKSRSLRHFESREEARQARDREQAEDFFALERILQPTR